MDCTPTASPNKYHTKGSPYERAPLVRTADRRSTNRRTEVPLHLEISHLAA